MYETYYPKPLEIICYHCQQSAEKAIKAIIMYYGSQGYRLLVAERHLVFYKVEKNQVIVYAVVDGRKKYRNLI